MGASLKTLTSTPRGDVGEISRRAQSLLLRNLNKAPDLWFRKAILKELKDPCCQAKQCLLNSSCDYMDDVLRIMREAKAHKEKLTDHAKAVVVDGSTGMAPRKSEKKPTKVKGLVGTSGTSRKRSAERISTLHTKYVIRDHLGQRRSTVSRLRNEFLEDNVTKLRRDGNFCIESIKRLLFASDHDLYGGKAPTLLERLDLRERRLRGSRTERGLPPLNDSEDVLDTRTFRHSVGGEAADSEEGEDINDCCNFQCSCFGRTANARLWDAFEEIDCLNDELSFYAGILWNRSLGRLSPVCYTHMVRIRISQIAL